MSLDDLKDGKMENFKEYMLESTVERLKDEIEILAEKVNRLEFEKQSLEKRVNELKKNPTLIWDTGHITISEDFYEYGSDCSSNDAPYPR